MTVLAFVIFLVSFVVAMVGVVVPVLPGAPVALLGGVIAAMVMGWERFGTQTVVYLAILAVVSQLVDLAGTYLGSRGFGASRPGVWGGVVGSLFGLFLFPPFGFLVGALAGAVAAEVLTGRELREAVRSGVGALVGTLGGTVAKLIVVVVMGFVAFPRFFGA